MPRPASPLSAISARSVFRWLFVLLGWLAPLALHAVESSVSAEFSPRNAIVGEPVELKIMIAGGKFDGPNPTISVEGLDLQPGSNRGFRVERDENGEVFRRTVLGYVLVPTRAGTFTLPELSLNVDGKVLKTLPQTLKVTAEEKHAETTEAIFGEIRLEKKSAYVGEAVPAEFRVYVASGYHPLIRLLPTALSGDGIAAKDFSRKPSERMVAIGNNRFYQATFRTIVTPTKTGDHTITLEPYKLSISKESRNTGFFQNDGPAQEVSITAPAVTLEAKALPAKGRPADFSGLIGKFTMEVLGTPNRVNLGEPVQMVVKITGEGNFDRVVTPPLDEPAAWRAYDAEENFAEGDDLGLSGVKTFKLPVAPTVPRTSMPVFAFSFFDSEAGTYKTLRNDPAPLTVIGTPAPAAPASPAVAAASPTPPPAPAPPQDILGNLPEPGQLLRPAVLSPKNVYLLLAAPLPLLFLLAWWHRRREDPVAARLAALRREKSGLLARLRQSHDRAEVLDAAAHILQLDAALATGQPPASHDLPAVLAARRVPASIVPVLESLFSARADLLYAGGGRAEALTPVERDRVLDAISTYEGSAAQ